MGNQITIRGRYGKSKRVESISFDSSRVYGDIRSFGHRSAVEYYIRISGEDRKITFENEKEMLSFRDQMVKKVEDTTLVDLSGLSTVRAEFIDTHEMAMYKDLSNSILFKETKYIFDLPRIGERFNSNGAQWKVDEFVRVDSENVRIYVSLTLGAL